MAPDLMSTRVPLPVWLAAIPAAVCLAAGGLLGFPVGGLALGLGVGAGLAGAGRLGELERARDFAPALLPAGGALGAALVTLLFGVFYLPQLAATAVFGWGAGVAAVAFLAIHWPGVWWRIALAALAAAGLVFAFHAMSLMQVVAARFSLGSAAAIVLLALGIELPAFLIRPQRRWVSLALSAAVGVGAGLVFGILSQWWYGLGGSLKRLGAGSPWLAAMVVGAVVGTSVGFSARLSEIVARAWRRRWQLALYFASMSLALGVAFSFLVAGSGMFAFGEDDLLGPALSMAMLLASFLVPSYFIRTSGAGPVRAGAIAIVLWFSVGLVWAGPWPHAGQGVAEGTAARSLLAMIPWKTSLGDADASRPRLVHFVAQQRRVRSLRWPRAFTVPENASLAKSFRCVKLTLDRAGEITRRLGVRQPCVLFLSPDGREIDRFTGG